MLERICSGIGILSIGNINPLNISVGINNPTNVPNIAAVCVFAVDETNIPNDRDVMINKRLSDKSKNKFPLIGTSSTK